MVGEYFPLLTKNTKYVLTNYRQDNNCRWSNNLILFYIYLLNSIYKYEKRRSQFQLELEINSPNTCIPFKLC